VVCVPESDFSNIRRIRLNIISREKEDHTTKTIRPKIETDDEKGIIEAKDPGA
jgi:hypothetical protein